MVFISSMVILFLGIVRAQSCTSNDQNAPDPSKCRITSSSDLVYALTPDNLQAGSNSAVIMKYDLDQDPMMKNNINAWDGGRDLYGKSAFDYTRWDGPLGM
jgi:hypothetical protein